MLVDQHLVMFADHIHKSGGRSNRARQGQLAVPVLDRMNNITCLDNAAGDAASHVMTHLVCPQAHF